MSSSAQSGVPRTDVPRLLAPADAALGLMALAGHVSSRAARRLAPVARPVVRFAVRPPFVPYHLQPPQVTAALRTRGGRARDDLASAAGSVLDRLVPLVLDQVLRRVDVTEVVVTRVDLGAIAARLDVQAVLERLDLAGIATQVIDAVDLPEVIRGSSGAMASETVLGARMRGIAGDQAIGRVRDRLLPHRHRSSPGGAPAIAEVEVVEVQVTFPAPEHP
jgi:hypothetical protein